MDHKMGILDSGFSETGPYMRMALLQVLLDLLPMTIFVIAAAA
jgi:hypothetical protein